ncbi:uncharacterized protein CG5098-like isoform X2 [Argopecten irradians]|uniref:uncharacterized protein CG5098-like isoform X2 n=1 Tax=Argopecten irradians TaxID=31199 RepID=UPI003717DE89
MPGPVERWLETFMCKQYADTFEAYGFKTLQSVCQLQHPQLQAMGVAQEHCEKILENVHVLRQTLYGQLNQNHYHEEMYPPGGGGRMPGGGAGPTGYQGQSSQPMPTIPQQNMANYQNQGSGNYDNRGQRVPSMHGQYSDGMYGRGHNQSSQHYMAHQSYGGMQGSGSVGQGPYGPGQYGQMPSGYGPMTGGRNYGSGSMSHSGRQQQQQQQQNHQQAQPQQQGSHVPSHMMHGGGQVQSPQDVANSILQMTAAYQPNQTVQVPLSKNRHAPYHVPNSPHYVMPSQGSSPTHQQQQQQQQQLQGPQGGHQFMYPSSSPHHSHPSRTSPISPSPGFIHSPASHHSNQSLPNSSPRSIQSPTQHPGSTGGSVKSPVPPPSPIGSLKSPCAMQSPMNAGQSICSPTPVNQQLHVSVSTQNIMPAYTGQSPTQQKNIGCYSPKTNPISPPASQISSPFTPLSKSSVQSPPQQDPYTSPHPTREYVSDGSQDPRDQASSSGGANPLLSLQKLCMLPEKQVIDPKSVVNDACLPSPQSRDNSKNLDANADSQGSGGQGSSQSESRCGSALGSSQSSQCADGRHCDEEKSAAGATGEAKPPPCDNAGLCSGDATSSKDDKPAAKDDDKESFHSSDPIDERNNSPPPLIDNSDMIGKPECSEEGDMKIDSKLKNVTCQQAIVNGSIQADFTSPCISQKSALTDEVLEEMKNQDIGEHLLKHRRSPNSVLSKARSLNCDVKLVYSDDCVLNGDDQIMDKLKLPSLTKNKLNSQTNDTEEDLCINVEKCGRICDKLDTSENASVESAKPSSAPTSPVVSSEMEIKQENVDKSDTNTPEQNAEDVEDSKSDVISPTENGVTVNKDKSETLSKNKVNSKRTQPERTMSLREVPARLANNAAYYNNYSDSDSNDDGILMVRKDTKATYSKLARNSLMNGIQTPDILSSEKSSDEDNEDCKMEPDYVDGVNDTKTDPEPWTCIDLSNDDTDVVAKDSLLKSRSTDKISQNLGNSVNKRKESICKKARKDKSRKLMEDYVDMASEEDDDEVSNLENVKKNIDAISVKNKTKKGQSGKNNPTHVESTSSETSKRKRRPRMSPLKYAGDMYYGGDYILDSDEEREIEVKSKRTRKPSGNPPEKSKPLVKSVVVLDSGEESSEDSDKKITPLNVDCKKESTADSHSSSHVVSSISSFPSGASSNPRDTPVIKIEKITENNQASDSKPDSSAKKESQKASCSVKKENSDGLSNKPSTTKKKCRRPQGSKSSKGKLKKLEKSKSRGGFQNDEDIEDIQLKRTLALMKKKHKKKPPAQRESTVGPFIRLEGNVETPTKCSVVNQLESDIQVDSKSSKHKKRSASVAVSTVHISRLPTEKSVMVPGSSVIDESTWVCALCKKHSSYKFLGDLFGPYYTEGNLPLPKVQEAPQQDSSSSGTKSKKRKSSDDNTLCDGADKSKRSKFKKSDPSTSRVPREVWVHEDCLAWADGVLLIGQKVYGLEEATRIASSMVCSVCKESGAMVGCLHKGCSQKYHFYCAIETGCSLEEENFSLWCPKHKAH